MKATVNKKWIRGAAASAAVMLGGIATPAGANFVLPAPSTDFCVMTGDFQSCLLPLIGINVDSQPGMIQNDIVVFVNAMGMNVNTNVDGIDNAYQSPGGMGDPDFFDTTDNVNYPDPTGGDPLLDFDTTWDADIDVIRSELMGGDFVIFFGNNDTNNINGLPGQDLLAWAEVRLIDNDGGVADEIFLLSAFDDQLGVPTPGVDEKADGLTAGMPDSMDPVGTGDRDNDQNMDDAFNCNGLLYSTPTFGGDCTDANNNGIADDLDDLHPAWAYVHGEACVASNGSLLHLGACQSFDPAGSTTENLNLGTNEVAFSSFNQELSDIINDPTSPFDFLSATIKLARLNNGGEVAFIKPMVNVSRIPPVFVTEPGTGVIALGSLGCALVGFALRRRRWKSVS